MELLYKSMHEWILHQGFSGKKMRNRFGYISKLKSKEFDDRLYIGCETKGESERQSKDFSVNHWKDGIAMDDCKRSEFWREIRSSASGKVSLRCPLDAQVVVSWKYQLRVHG